MRINVHWNTKVTDEAAEVKLKASRIRGIMGFLRISAAALLLPAVLTMCLPRQARANGDIHKVKHVIIVMQENHSFDNYFGALAYAPGSPYHTTSGGCRHEDHNCVDGLSCKVDAAGNLTCFNSNLDGNGTTVFAFHDSRRCVVPDLDHSWLCTHQEANFLNPNGTLGETLIDGFVRVNDATEQLDKGVENATDDQTMSFYNQDEIPFYYNLAANFAVNDRYFSPMLGPTFTNRAYFMAATSFGHLSTNDEFPPPGDISRSAERFSICWIKMESHGPTIFRMLRKERASGCSGRQAWTRTFCPFSCFWRRLAERQA